MTAGVGQPNYPGILVFELKDVLALPVNPPADIPPIAVVNAGDQFQLRVKLGLSGVLAGLLAGEQFSVVHHVENIETGDRKTLAASTVTFPPPPACNDFEHTTGPFSAAASGVGDLVVPSGFDAGTFRILTHLHAVNPAIKPLLTGFHDGLVLMVVK